MKEKWEKPKLVVLVRAEPEESVLGGCKTDEGGGTGSTGGQGGESNICKNPAKCEPTVTS